VIEAVASTDDELDPSQIIRRVHLPVATTHRLIGTLTSLGYLTRHEEGSYQLGTGWLRLREAAITALPMLARPHLTRLVDNVGESASLAVRNGHEVRYLAHVKSRHSKKAAVRPGQTAPIHRSAVGKAILANMPEAHRRRVLQRARALNLGATSGAELQRLLHQLSAAASCGYVTDAGELKPGLHSIAVAVTGAPTELAVSITVPDARMTSTLVDRAVPVLQAIARALSAELQ
jgi:IclR family acetate operon transcriptional repressor